MENVALRSVSKVFRHSPAFFNWVGRERAGETRALDQVSLTAGPGEVLVLLGPNGSGKTTLLKLVATILLPDAGRVLVEGVDTCLHPERVQRAVGFALASEKSFFPRLTARENLDLFAALEDVPRRSRPERVEKALENCGLTAAGDTQVIKFSSGMFQRLGIARALLKRPSVLLLDEPTRSLDPGAAARLWQLVRETAAKGATVMVATHNFNEAVSVGHSVAVLSDGRLTTQRSIRPSLSVEELRTIYFRELEAKSSIDLLVRGVQ